jgi:steroid delta-isomerase-like uncharacterized protein
MSAAGPAAEGTPGRGPGDLARAYFAATNTHDLDAMAACWKPGGHDVIHGVVDMTVPADLRSWFGTVFGAVPDLRFEVLDVAETAGKAALRWHLTGTFDGTARFEGLLPNGATIDLEGVDFLTFEGDLIVRNDAYLNGAELARQLGALPAQGSLAEKASAAALNLKTRAGALARRRAR